MERSERGRLRDLRRVLALIRRARFQNGLHCPRCGGRRIHRWGRFLGRQRYRCRRNGREGCGRTFSDLTGTPAAHVKKLDRWMAYLEHLESCLTVRASALTLGVDPSTTFRWRHRLLKELERRDGDRVGGWIELGPVHFVESLKGQRRDLGRPARTRRMPVHQRLRSPRVTVAVAMERETQEVVSAVVHEVSVRRPTVRGLAIALSRRIRPTPDPDVIMEFGALSPWARFVTAVLGGRAHRVWDSPVPFGCPGGSLDVAAQKWYGARLRRWIRRFRGVATRYLANYLIWHRRLDTSSRPSLRDLVLCWPLGP